MTPRNRVVEVTAIVVTVACCAAVVAFLAIAIVAFARLVL